jgi:hypothetical protein
VPVTLYASAGPLSSGRWALGVGLSELGGGLCGLVGELGFVELGFDVDAGVGNGFGVYPVEAQPDITIVRPITKTHPRWPRIGLIELSAKMSQALWSKRSS